MITKAIQAFLDTYEEWKEVYNSLARKRIPEDDTKDKGDKA